MLIWNMRRHNLARANVCQRRATRCIYECVTDDYGGAFQPLFLSREQNKHQLQYPNRVRTNMNDNRPATQTSDLHVQTRLQQAPHASATSVLLKAQTVL